MISTATDKEREAALCALKLLIDQTPIVVLGSDMHLERLRKALAERQAMLVRVTNDLEALLEYNKQLEERLHGDAIQQQEAAGQVPPGSGR